MKLIFEGVGIPATGRVLIGKANKVKDFFDFVCDRKYNEYGSITIISESGCKLFTYQAEAILISNYYTPLLENKIKNIKCIFVNYNRIDYFVYI